MNFGDFLEQYLALSKQQWEFQNAEEKPLWGWVAGIMDGEGSVQIVRLYHQGRDHYHNNLVLSVTNTNRAMVLRLKEITHVGAIGQANRPTKGHKVAHRWVCKTQQATTVLLLCLPWLVTKQQHAVIALAFHDLQKMPHRFQRPLPEWNVSKRGALIEALHILNKRGIKEG